MCVLLVDEQHVCVLMAAIISLVGICPHWVPMESESTQNGTAERSVVFERGGGVFKQKADVWVRTCCLRESRWPSPYWTSSDGLAGLGPWSSGTGDVASIRAGFRMIGRDMGGTPTCSGEARGCRIRGGWLRAAGGWVGEDASDAGVAGLLAGGTGEERSGPTKK